MLSRCAIEDVEAIVRSTAVDYGTYPKPQSRTVPTAPVRPYTSRRTGPAARPAVHVPIPNVHPFSGPAYGARAPARAPARALARAHAPIRFGNSKPGLRGSARSALASFANAPVWRSVFGSKVSHGPTT
jgi:hypothetical protein